jgi:hypothetical protein
LPRKRSTPGVGSWRHSHLAEEPARGAGAYDPLLAADDLGDLDRPGDDHEQRPLVALVGEVLPRGEPDVLHGAREIVQRRIGQRSEDPDPAQLGNGDHVPHATRETHLRR